MRIGLLIGTNQIGGTERQVLLLAEGLVAAGIPTTVYFMDRLRPLRIPCNRQLNFKHIKCVRLWASRPTFNLSQKYFVYRLKKDAISLLHMFGLKAMKYATCPTVLVNINNVVGGIRNIRFLYDQHHRTELTKMCQHLKFVTCNCSAIKDLVTKLDICPPEKIRVIRNGVAVNCEPSYDTVSRKETIPRNVLWVGTLKSEKTPEIFIQTAFMLLENNTNLTFTIAGDGPLKNLIVDLIRKSRWARKFSLLGAVPPHQIPYQKACVVVSTSKHEGSSNAILEALANGLPVVATSVGGSKEILSGQAFGRLVDCDDEKATANAAMAFLNKDGQELRGISEEARSYIRDNHSVAAMIQKHRELYEKIVLN